MGTVRHSTIGTPVFTRTIIRFANMNRLTKNTIRVGIAAVLFFITGFGYWEFVLRRPIAREDPWRLWIAAHKGFEGIVTYVGDKDGYSYFQTGDDRTPRYKRKAADVKLPRTFPYGLESGYRVDSSMVPQYNPVSK